jgi:hypothetical protein
MRTRQDNITDEPPLRRSSRNLMSDDGSADGGTPNPNGTPVSGGTRPTVRCASEIEPGLEELADMVFQYRGGRPLRAVRTALLALGKNAGNVAVPAEVATPVELVALAKTFPDAPDIQNLYDSYTGINGGNPITAASLCEMSVDWGDAKEMVDNADLAGLGTVSWVDFVDAVLFVHDPSALR